MKRFFDFICSLILLMVLSPVLLVLAIWVGLDSPGGVFYKQERVGKGGKVFRLLKFRSMRPGSDKKGLLTVGFADNRITGAGRFLRKTKLDELPQLINVLKGDMSLVGPRPEVPRYVAMYNEVQQRVLDVRPGITDHASIRYFEENELLAQSSDPERTYIEEIMPKKLAINLEYVNHHNLMTDLGILFRTFLRMVRG
ncbi:MAG: sugar transferase [Flavobacteriales bacterium]|nr:sugar transferase [Flavobacteriales bacterium]MCB9447733.1 sugar transferase [Flavobacteriales bacterium]